MTLLLIIYLTSLASIGTMFYFFAAERIKEQRQHSEYCDKLTYLDLLRMVLVAAMPGINSFLLLAFLILVSAEILNKLDKPVN